MIVIASNRVSGCGLEVRWGHPDFWDFYGALGNKLSSLPQEGRGRAERDNIERMISEE